MTTDKPDRIDRIEIDIQALANTAKSQQESIAGLVQTINLLAQENRASRAEFQAEITRIWEYLMDRRSGNGDQGS